VKKLVAVVQPGLPFRPTLTKTQVAALIARIVDEVNSRTQTSVTDDSSIDTHIEASLSSFIEELKQLAPDGFMTDHNCRILTVSLKKITRAVAYHLISAAQREDILSELKKVLTNITFNFMHNLSTIARRCTENIEAINRAFQRSSTHISDIEITDSDPHNGGQRVAIITLDDGFKIVYKPREVRVDAKIVGDDITDRSLSAIINEIIGAKTETFKR
jgi:hypothetical protein